MILFGRFLALLSLVSVVSILLPLFLFATVGLEFRLYNMTEVNMISALVVALSSSIVTILISKERVFRAFAFSALALSLGLAIYYYSFLAASRNIFIGI